MTPNVDPWTGKDVQSLYAWTRAQLGRLAYVLGGRVLPEDQFDADEIELTFAALGEQNIIHSLARIPLRVETVRADQGGGVYVTARGTGSITVNATATGTYRIRIS